MVCIGWDVGGMHGEKNALCMLKEENNWQCDISSFKKPKNAAAPEQKAEEIVETICKASKGTTLLAIDAPLSFPLAFREAIGSRSFDHPLPNMSEEGLIDNPLAFRDCERFVFCVTGKRPLSGSFDQLTNLTLLVQRVLYLLKVECGKQLNVMPNDGTEIKEGINVLETYPALLNPNETVERKKDGIQVTSNNFLQFALKLLKEDVNKHQRDANLCALFAAYAASHPEVLQIPKEFRGDLKREGWIYWPENPDLEKRSIDNSVSSCASELKKSEK